MHAVGLIGVESVVVLRYVAAFSLGLFREGERLPPVTEIAASFGVSEAQARGARSRLSELGYLMLRRGRSGGAFVTRLWGQHSAGLVREALPSSRFELETELDLRALTEQSVARTAAERHDTDDARRMIAAMLRHEQSAADPARAVEADQAFHRSVALATHNGRLADASSGMRHRMCFGFDREPHSADVSPVAVQHHRALVGAILDHRESDAADVAREHVELTADRLRSLHRCVSVEVA